MTKINKFFLLQLCCVIFVTWVLLEKQNLAQLKTIVYLILILTRLSYPSSKLINVLLTYQKEHIEATKINTIKAPVILKKNNFFSS